MKLNKYRCMVAQSLVTTVIFGLTYWVAFAMTFAMTAR